ncbi:MAG TPA: hypothetical protein PK668_18685 [Myxococcota bacterium]|nr:hypothetical protein [Myxococcota bacterium]HRY96579.1 hypothetical protein [Myxococcota bacterium]HSA20849.1 hypothetical protein [Myxococcota bacterium]
MRDCLVRLSGVVLAGVLACGAVACGADLPPERLLGVVQGNIVYRGQGLEGQTEPRLSIVVLLEPWSLDDWESWTFPNAFRIYEAAPLAPDGLDFELTHLEPGHYEVLAFLGVEGRPSTEPVAVGAYPNLLQMGDRPVEVLEAQVTEGIDFELYDF